MKVISQLIKNVLKSYSFADIKWNLVSILSGFTLCILLSMLGENWKEAMKMLFSSIFGITVTLLVVDEIYHLRDIEKLKNRLKNEAGSTANNTALSAVDWMRREGWLNGEKENLLKGAKLRRANLVNGILNYAILEGADMHDGKFTEARFYKANLKKTDLRWTDFKGAYLRCANLDGARLAGAKFTGAYWGGASLENVKWKYVATKEHERTDAIEFEDLQDISKRASWVATLPDGKKWVQGTDTRRFTDFSHPDFDKTLKQINEIRDEMGYETIKTVRKDCL